MREFMGEKGLVITLSLAIIGAVKSSRKCPAVTGEGTQNAVSLVG
jgi:hypothetical protein